MAKTPTGELFSTIKSYLTQLSDGERTPNEVASALNGWARESAESIKAKIAEEVESQVSKMGFIKRAEYEKLAARVAQLESKGASRTLKKAPAKKSAAIKSGSTKGKVTKKASAKKVGK